MSHVIRSCGAALAALIHASVGRAEPYSWFNLDEYPDDLIKTGDAWSAVRVEDPGFVSYRIAAEDFVLSERTRISTVEFYSIPLNDPIVLGADLYIFFGTNAPESLVYAEPGALTRRVDTGLVNTTLGAVYSNRMFPADLELAPGRYFLAFRSWITLEGAPSSKHVAMTTRWTNGDTRALWNFDVLADGTVVGDWVTMDVFSGFVDNEWAFEIRGRTTANDLSLEGPIPGSAGEINRLGVRNATPGERVYFFRGSERGEAIVPSCGGLVIEINDPSFIAIQTADAGGVASISRFVPPSATGRTVLLQAVEIMDCRMSNLVRHTFD